MLAFSHPLNLLAFRLARKAQFNQFLACFSQCLRVRAGDIVTVQKQSIKANKMHLTGVTLL